MHRGIADEALLLDLKERERNRDSLVIFKRMPGWIIRKIKFKFCRQSNARQIYLIAESGGSDRFRGKCMGPDHLFMVKCNGFFFFFFLWQIYYSVCVSGDYHKSLSFLLRQVYFKCSSRSLCQYLWGLDSESPPCLGLLFFVVRS